MTRTKTGKLYQPRVNSDATKKYFFDVWYLIKQKIASEGIKSLRSSTISLNLWVHPPDNRKRDLDGILKVLIDALQNAGLFDDDFQVAKLYVERCDVVDGGKVVAKIYSIDMSDA